MLTRSLSPREQLCCLSGLADPDPASKEEMFIQGAGLGRGRVGKVAYGRAHEAHAGWEDCENRRSVQGC